MPPKHLLFVACVLAGVSAMEAAQCSVTAGASDAGWYNASGFHDPASDNYFAGYSAASQTEYRNWFTFELPAFTAPVVGATLRIQAFEMRASGSVTVELHEVSTPLEALTNGGAGLTNVFADLGDGPSYATSVISTSQANSFISIPLNSNAVAQIAANSGQRFAIGGRVTSFVPGAAIDENLFGYSYGPTANVQLTIAFGSATTPVFLAQPPTNYFSPTGALVSLAVTACGAAPLSYQWFFNTLPLSGQTNSTLTIKSVAPTNTGDYFVTVTNAFGAITSSVTHLFANAQPPAIVSLNYSREVTLDDSIIITADVRGIPFPDVRWLFNGSLLPGETNYQLLISSAQISNSGTYTIVASNAYGVLARDVPIDVVPAVINGPYDSTIALGEDSYLSCSVQTSLTPAFQWRLFGTNIPGANTVFLPIFNATEQDAGLYSVVVSVAGYSRTSSVAQVLVQPTAPQLGWMPDPIMIEGASCVLPHFVSGSPPITYEWYFNGNRIQGATNASLLFESITTNDAGIYQFVASNPFGSATHSYGVVVARRPPTAQALVPQRTIHAGDTVVLAMSVDGAPSPKCQWKFSGTNIANATNTSLLLTNVSTTQSGDYVCTARNAYGTNAAPVTLTILPRRALDQWTARNPIPHANDLEHIAVQNGRYVAVGEGGSIVTSSNAIDWTSVALGHRYTLLGLAAGNGIFAALVQESVGVFTITSFDGLSWTAHAIPQSSFMRAISFEQGHFHAWGVDGGLVRRFESIDGANWSSSLATDWGVPGVGGAPRTTAYGAGHYVAAIPPYLGISTDGIRFTPRLAPGGGFNRVRYLNGMFVVVGSGGIIYMCADAQHWQPRYAPTSASLEGVAYGNGRFVVVGEDGTILTSTDNGLTWNLAPAGVKQNLKDVLFDGVQFVACGNDGVLLTSVDGSNWADRRRGSTRDLYGIIFTNGLFVAVGYEGTILTSSNGMNWVQQTAPNTRDLHSIAYAAGQFIVVGRKGTVLTSTDAIHWVQRSTPTTNYLQRVAYGNGRFVAVGSAGTIISSTNASDWQWQPNPAPPGAELEGIAFGHGNVFVAVGAFGSGGVYTLMLVSTNGTDWSNASFDMGKTLRAIAWDGTRFQAVGNDGVTIFSVSGTNWSAQGSVEFVPPFRNLRQVRFAAGRFVAVGNEGAVISKRNGWVEHASIAGENLHDIAFGAGKFVAVGNAGTIVQSDDALPVFSSPQLSGGQFRFVLRGGLEDIYTIQSTDAFTNWAGAGTFTNTGTAVPFSLIPLSENPDSHRRFFRVTYP